MCMYCVGVPARMWWTHCECMWCVDFLECVVVIPCMYCVGVPVFVVITQCMSCVDFPVHVW